MLFGAVWGVWGFFVLCGVFVDLRAMGFAEAGPATGGNRALRLEGSLDCVCGGADGVVGSGPPGFGLAPLPCEGGLLRLSILFCGLCVGWAEPRRFG